MLELLAYKRGNARAVHAFSIVLRTVGLADQGFNHTTYGKCKNSMFREEITPTYLCQMESNGHESKQTVVK